jgi:hypothetical protein
MGRKSQFTEEQIMQALREVDAGAKPADVCRRLGVTEATSAVILPAWRSPAEVRQASKFAAGPCVPGLDWHLRCLGQTPCVQS